MNLQHLLPYLPDVTCNNGVSKEAKIKYLYIEKNRVCFDSGMSVPISAECFKMNLRPLSDLLDEESEFKLTKEINLLPGNCDVYSDWIESFCEDPTAYKISQAPNEIHELLVKKKYDVFDLIYENQAIDINTLKP